MESSAQVRIRVIRVGYGISQCWADGYMLPIYSSVSGMTGEVEMDLQAGGLAFPVMLDILLYFLPKKYQKLFARESHFGLAQCELRLEIVPFVCRVKNAPPPQGRLSPDISLYDFNALCFKLQR